MVLSWYEYIRTLEGFSTNISTRRTYSVTNLVLKGSSSSFDVCFLSYKLAIQKSCTCRRPRTTVHVGLLLFQLTLNSARIECLLSYRTIHTAPYCCKLYDTYCKFTTYCSQLKEKHIYQIRYRYFLPLPTHGIWRESNLVRAVN